MYEYSFIIVIMIFEYNSNISSTTYIFCVLEIVAQAAFFIWVKTDQGRMQCDVESLEVFHIIDSINIQLGQIGSNQQQKWMWHVWGIMQTVRKYFISLILSYKVREKNICSVLPSTKSAQAISSIFSPNIQLGPNWQQSTTKMAVARLRCDADSSVLFHIIDTNM